MAIIILTQINGLICCSVAMNTHRDKPSGHRIRYLSLLALDGHHVMSPPITDFVFGLLPGNAHTNLSENVVQEQNMVEGARLFHVCFYFKTLPESVLGTSKVICKCCNAKLSYRISWSLKYHLN